MDKFKSTILSVAMIMSACSATQTKTQTVLTNQPLPVASIQQVQQVQQAITSNDQIELTLKQIMSNPDWLGREPQRAGWSIDGQQIVYSRKREGSPVLDTYKASAGIKNNGEKVLLSEKHEFVTDEHIDDLNQPFVAWIFENNIYSFDRASGKVSQLTHTSDGLRNLKYLNSDEVSFQSGNRFFAVNAKTGNMKEMLSWKFEDKPALVNAPDDYIAEQQIALIDYIALQRKNRSIRIEEREKLIKENSTVVASTVYLKKGHETVLSSMSPNGKYAIIVSKETTKSRSDNDIMPDYIEENGRIKAQAVRKRVADAKSEKHTLWLVDVVANNATEISYTSLPGYNEDVLVDVKIENANAKGEVYTANRLPRDIGLLFDWYASEMPIKWHKNSNNVALMLEAWDNKDRWLATINVLDKKLTSQHRMHDKAWVNYKFNEFGWLHNSEQLYYLSEQSGYSQLYIKPLNGAERALTSGKFEVNNPTVSDDESHIYFKANKKHPGIYEVYRLNINAGTHIAMTDLNGMTDFVLSPDESTLLLTHSTTVMPPELLTVSAIEPRDTPIKITHTVSDAFLSLEWTAPTIIPIPSSHTNEAIYSRVYAPKEISSQLNTNTKQSRNMLNKDDKYKAVVFSHGAGYLQNSHLGWSGYFREFMFHSFLVSKGYVVLDMDYRASAGYGRDWRTAIYRQMGTPEIQDLKDGVDWLVNNANVDASRVGTYGGSYGGFMTFMALFTAPDLFQAGAALRPVSDWAHYNHPYTSNILNTPDIDPIAYERSSPIYFAEGLTKPLLINAPMVDNNVFFVDVVRLVQRLIELEKENFETAIYPVEPHGFVQPSSWLDEYRRIYKLFEEEL